MSVCIKCLKTINLLKKSQPLTSRLLVGKYSSDTHQFKFEPSPDLEYLLDPANFQVIKDNIKNRKGIGDIGLLRKILEEYKLDPSDSVKRRLEKAALLIPNKTSPDTIIGSELKIVKTHNGTTDEDEHSQSFESICKRFGLLRFQDLLTSTLVYGYRSYCLMGDLARLERALVRWTVDRLRDKGWQYVVVPDLIPEGVINACGFVTTGRQNQIYKVRKEQGSLCFAGTSEIPLAAMYAGKSIGCEKPLKLCAYSPCYRAEEAKNRVDKGFYRLHQFNKVEMFAVCMPDQSEALLEEIVGIQCELFSELGLSYRLIQMPSEELGAAAYKKYDIEAWIKSLKYWGEVSSASNCTDYQARRLSMTVKGEDQFAHTVNGTACAVPRMLMCLIEQNHTKAGSITIPKCLQPYMRKTHLTPNIDHLKTEMVRGRNKFF